jgi:2-keto-3-deoxy-L-rhamnonate aldolase RhmA
MTFESYISEANEKVALIIQIEHIRAVENINAILKVPGIDAVFVGPYDLSGSLNKIGQVEDPEVGKAIAAVREACREVGIPIGIFGASPKAVKPYLAEGYQLITVGTDTLMLGKIAQDYIADLKE